MINKIKNILNVEVPFWLFGLCFLLLVVFTNIDTPDPTKSISQQQTTKIKLSGPDGETLFEFEISEPSTDDDDDE